MNNQADITTVYALRRWSRASRADHRRPERVSNPVFDKGGKYLYFLASTEPAR